MGTDGYGLKWPPMRLKFGMWPLGVWFYPRIFFSKRLEAIEVLTSQQLFCYDLGIEVTGGQYWTDWAISGLPGPIWTFQYIFRIYRTSGIQFWYRRAQRNAALRTRTPFKTRNSNFGLCGPIWEFDTIFRIYRISGVLWSQGCLDQSWVFFLFFKTIFWPPRHW